MQGIPSTNILFKFGLGISEGGRSSKSCANKSIAIAGAVQIQNVLWSGIDWDHGLSKCSPSFSLVNLGDFVALKSCFPGLTKQTCDPSDEYIYV